MKFIVATLLVWSACVTGAVIRRDVLFDKEANDMASGKCAPVAAIFARGTFDEGNIGVWVGPQLLSPLKDKGVAVQGVDAKAYAATLGGYLSEGGPTSAAKSMANTVNQYVKKCGPETAIIISGWSEGALVAHKALSYLSPAAKTSLAGFITFGDPARRFNLASPPSSIPSKSYCVSGVPYDPLCSDIHIPKVSGISDAIKQIEEPFKKLPTIAHGAQQTKSAAELVLSFPKQLWVAKGTFAKDVLTGDIGKLMLSPQHFTYGNSGQAEDAAKWVLSLPSVKKALTGDSTKGGKATDISGKTSTSAAASRKGVAATSTKGGVDAKLKVRRSLALKIAARDNFRGQVNARDFDAKLNLFQRSLYAMNREKKMAIAETLHRRAQVALQSESLYSG